MHTSLPQVRLIALLATLTLIAGVAVAFELVTSSAPGEANVKTASAPTTSTSTKTTTTPTASTATNVVTDSTVAPSTAAPSSTTTTTTSSSSPPPPPPPPPIDTAPVPSAWPDAINTGVPPGVALKPSGGLTITDDGTVVDGLDVDGCIIVRASSVTIRNTRVRQNGLCWGGAIDTEYGPYSNIVIQDVEVDGRRQNPNAPLVGSGGYTCVRCNLHDGGQGFHLTSNVVVGDSYVHDLYGAGSSHNDAVLSNGGTHFVVRHNTLLCDVGFPGNASPGGGCTGAFNLFGDFGQIDDVVADGNWFQGGSYCVYAGSGFGKTYPNSTHVRITNNQFVRTAPHWSDCGQYGPYTGYAANTGNVWSGNTWMDTGAPIA